jgi:hypothetical protein
MFGNQFNTNLNFKTQTLSNTSFINILYIFENWSLVYDIKNRYRMANVKLGIMQILWNWISNIIVNLSAETPNKITLTCLLIISALLNTDNKILLMPMGVLTTVYVHAWCMHGPPINITGHFSSHMSSNFDACVYKVTIKPPSPQKSYERLQTLRQI